MASAELEALRRVYKKLLEIEGRLKTVEKNTTRKKPSGPKLSEEEQALVDRVIDYLNQTAGTRFRSDTSAHQSMILARIEEGYSERELLEVVQAKAIEAKAGDFDPKYLRPATLFNREKFNQYAGQL